MFIISFQHIELSFSVLLLFLFYFILTSQHYFLCFLIMISRVFPQSSEPVLTESFIIHERMSNLEHGLWGGEEGVMYCFVFITLYVKDIVLHNSVLKVLYD